MNVAKSEESMSRELSRYLRVHHPELEGLYHFDFGSGLKMDKATAMRQALLNRRSWPDLFLAKRSSYGDVFAGGLFLELKRDGTRLKKRDGTWASDHIAEQSQALLRLREEGFVAEFAVGLDEAIELIESYLNPAGRPPAPEAASLSNLFDDEVPF